MHDLKLSWKVFKNSQWIFRFIMENLFRQETIKTWIDFKNRKKKNFFCKKEKFIFKYTVKKTDVLDQDNYMLLV